MPVVPVCTYWPAVHAVAGVAVTQPMVATDAGGVEPGGVQVPGMPAVAPVADFSSLMRWLADRANKK